MIKPEQMFNHEADKFVVNGQTYVRVDIISDICKAVETLIEQGAVNTTDPALLLRGAGMLEFSRELRLQLAKLKG